VAEVLTGPNWGSQFIPRIGTELLVNFNVGDMDRTCGDGLVAQQF
jgi:type VI secretion system secreted protein VgrG